MGHLFWPNHWSGYRSLLLGLSFIVTTANAQWVPDDIAFKPVAHQTSPIPNQPAANPITHPTDAQDCKATRQWQKKLVIMAMPRLSPSSSNAGNLYRAEAQIPQILADALDKSPSIDSQLHSLASQQDLTEEKRRQQARDIAANAEGQFVLSGEIIDMSMRDASTTYNPSIVQSLRNHFTDATLLNFTDNRDRYFSLRLVLRDGFTGDLLLEEYFHTSGIWKETNPIGFDSPALWKTHYGRKIKTLVNLASRQLISHLECQPFMARLDFRPGQNEMMLQAGANNGLNAGDRLNLYQVVMVASETQYDSYQTRLIKRASHLQLKEVYPSHSLARLIDNDLLNGQYLAVGEE